MGRTAIEGAVKSGSLTVRLRYLLLATTIFAVSFLILATHTSYILIDQPSDISREIYRYTVVNSQQIHTIQTEGCSIPAMELISPAIKEYIYYPTKIKPCPDASLSLLKSNETNIWVVRENLPKYDFYKLNQTISCCYKGFIRPKYIEDIASDDVDHRVKYARCTYFYDIIAVTDEFVRVTCSVRSKKVVEEYFLFAPKKNFLPRAGGLMEKSKTDPAYNVLIIGIDGVSRLNFHRTMPKTLKFLKDKGAVEMMGYNKVGDNTFPNLIPMLMGLKSSELKNICFPHSKATFDYCPFIWEWFRQAGFYTALAEDSSFLGTFNYIKMGFTNTPTDYYIHTFIHQAEHNIGENKDFNSYLCMHHIPFYKVLLNYIQDLTTTLKSSKLFGFFWEITMSHDHLNYPMLMDDDYVHMFNKLHEKTYLNDSIVFVVSDHGIRWGGIRSTKQGRLEERLPFLYVLTPPSFRKQYSSAYRNLKLNSQRLTTPFDLYATLIDLIDLNINDETVSSRSMTNYAHNRGISLFLPVPDNRTCKMADIDDHWCTCHKDIVISKNDPKVLTAAAALENLLNKMLDDYPQCATLMLTDVLEVSMVKNEYSGEELLMVVRTAPGGGIFEVTLREEDNEWSLLGTASRLNLYGNQSYCVHHALMKLYCYCI